MALVTDDTRGSSMTARWPRVDTSQRLVDLTPGESDVATRFTLMKEACCAPAPGWVGLNRESGSTWGNRLP